jgi:hypothetical protein
VRRGSMRVIIQVAARDSAKAWALLVQHSAGTALPNRTFIVSVEAAQALRDAGIKFKEISSEPGSPTTGGVIAGERI